jgi:hypothetical protein
VQLRGESELTHKPRGHSALDTQAAQRLERRELKAEAKTADEEETQAESELQPCQKKRATEQKTREQAEYSLVRAHAWSKALMASRERLQPRRQLPSKQTCATNAVAATRGAIAANEQARRVACLQTLDETAASRKLLEQQLEPAGRVVAKDAQK